MNRPNFPVRKLTLLQVKDIRDRVMRKPRLKLQTLADLYGVHVETIRDVVNNRTWIDPEYKRCW